MDPFGNYYQNFGGEEFEGPSTWGNQEVQSITLEELQALLGGRQLSPVEDFEGGYTTVAQPETEERFGPSQGQIFMPQTPYGYGRVQLFPFEEESIELPTLQPVNSEYEYTGPPPGTVIPNPFPNGLPEPISYTDLPPGTLIPNLFPYGELLEPISETGPLPAEPWFQNEAIGYAFVSLLVLIVAGYGTRRAYNEYKNRTNIKKEINRRFNFNRDDENPAGNFRENLNSRNEESKRNDDSNNGSGGSDDKNKGIFSRGMAMAGIAAAGLAAKVSFKKESKKTDEDDDPTRYHQLDDGADQQQQSSNNKTSRLWTYEGVKIIDESNKVVMSSEPTQKNANLIGTDEPVPQKVKAMAVIEEDVPEELQDIDLDKNEQVQMQYDDRL